MENLPIDIHSNKLIDWLISRRHCPKKWRDAVDGIRTKISHAIQDMPVNEQILAILSSGQYITYFHCKKILEILRETEKETKNIFGLYSSQRMKEWKEICLMYERENLYLAESANFLQRFVQYEVPALRRQIAKAESVTRDAERKEQDYMKQAAESRRAFERELAKWALNGEGDIRSQLLAAADGLAPVELGGASELRKALSYFAHFSKFVGKEEPDMFPLASLVISALDAQRSLSDLSVFEWRHGHKPEVIIPHTRLDPLSDPKDDAADEIDFGDDEAEIDFCTNGDSDGIIEVVSVEGDESPKMDSIERSVARGEDAIPLLEHLGVRGEFLDELDQLSAFLNMRVQDELVESVASIYLAGILHRPPEVGAVSIEELKAWLTALTQVVRELAEPNRVQLLRIRTSPYFVDEVVSQLEQKRRLEAKYQQLGKMSVQKQQQCTREIKEAQKLLDAVIEAAKGLQEELERDLSRRYNGREVYIMGEINAVLYGS